MELLRVKRLGKVIQPYNQRAKLASWRPRPNLAKALSLFLYVVKYVTVVLLLYDSKASFKPYSIIINTLCVKTFIFPTRKIRKIRSHWPMYPYISVPFNASVCLVRCYSKITNPRTTSETNGLRVERAKGVSYKPAVMLLSLTLEIITEPDQLIFSAAPKQFIRGKNNKLSKWCWDNWTSSSKRMESSSTEIQKS